MLKFFFAVDATKVLKVDIKWRVFPAGSAFCAIFCPKMALGSWLNIDFENLRRYETIGVRSVA